MTTATAAGSQTYYAECRQPDEERGLRIAITLTKTSEFQELPELIPNHRCFMLADCANGGAHDLLPISEDAARKLVAHDDDPAGNVFEWHWEHSKAEGDDRRVLLYLAFHAEDRDSALPYPDELEDDLKLSLFAVDSAVAHLIATKELAVDWDAFTYTLPAYEQWRAAQ